MATIGKRESESDVFVTFRSNGYCDFADITFAFYLVWLDHNTLVFPLQSESFVVIDFFPIDFAWLIYQSA